MTGAKVMLTIASVLAIAAASYLPHATAPAVVSKGSAPPIVAKAPTENASVASVEPRMLAQRPSALLGSLTRTKRSHASPPLPRFTPGKPGPSTSLTASGPSSSSP